MLLSILLIRLKKSWEVSLKNIGENWRFYENGGDARLWYGNIIDVVDWGENSVSYYKDKGGLT
ncbi:unnamed protein product, partial [marine sediment metagenome]